MIEHVGVHGDDVIPVGRPLAGGAAGGEVGVIDGNRARLPPRRGGGRGKADGDHAALGVVIERLPDADGRRGGFAGDGNVVSCRVDAGLADCGRAGADRSALDDPRECDRGRARAVGLRADGDL